MMQSRSQLLRSSTSICNLCRPVIIPINIIWPLRMAYGQLAIPTFTKLCKFHSHCDKAVLVVKENGHLITQQREEGGGEEKR